MLRQVMCYYFRTFYSFSAGVGRTGTFIALDIMLERIPQTHDVNVLECVQNMRANRTFMVQTKVCHPCDDAIRVMLSIMYE